MVRLHESRLGWAALPEFGPGNHVGVVSSGIPPPVVVEVRYLRHMGMNDLHFPSQDSQSRRKYRVHDVLKRQISRKWERREGWYE